MVHLEEKEIYELNGVKKRRKFSQSKTLYPTG